MVEIRVPDDLARALDERARAIHADINSRAERLLRRALAVPTDVSQICPDVAERFRRSGMTDDELAAELERAKHDARTDRKRNGAA
jgi:hypothetical protein